jgi:hypothetical protein
VTWKTIILFISASAILLATACTTSSTTPVNTPTSTAVQTPDPWPGVPVYRDSTTTIKTRVNETFSFALPPAPLFGWGWQNKDLSAFSLVETKSVPGPANETNTYGPNAFLFKALETGTFQITLYIPSKPPQQTEAFNIVVNP